MAIKFEVSREGLIGDIRDWWNTRNKNSVNPDQVKEIRLKLKKMNEDQLDDLLESKIASKSQDVGFTSAQYSTIKEAMNKQKKYLSLFKGKIVPLVNKVISRGDKDTDKLVIECENLDKEMRKQFDVIGFSRLDYVRISSGTYKAFGYTKSNIIDLVNFFDAFNTFVDQNSPLIQYYRQAQLLENKLSNVSSGHDEGGAFQILEAKNKACDKAMDLLDLLNGGVIQREVSDFVLDRILPRLHSTVMRIAD